MVQPHATSNFEACTAQLTKLQSSHKSSASPQTKHFAGLKAQIIKNIKIKTSINQKPLGQNYILMMRIISSDFRKYGKELADDDLAGKLKLCFGEKLPFQLEI